MAGCPQRAVLPEGQPTNGIAFDTDLVPVTMPSQLPNGWGPTKLRDCQLLAALMFGASLLRGAPHPDEPESASAVGRNDYELVRRLLQSPLLCAADEPVTQLAVDMVGRTNVFLELKCHPEWIEGNPLRGNDGDPTWRIRGGRTRQELTTRNEVADLGNIHSRLVQEIVNLLQSVPDGSAMFRRMGLVRQPPNERDFKKSDLRTLARMLRSWSFKQVRTHFDAMRKASLISGERDSANAPWRYRLPEQLSLSSSPFRSLPTANELFSETGPST